jgi:hypothetical protein
MKGNCSDVVHARSFYGLLVQRLNIAKRVGESQARNLDSIGRQPIKHECIVGVGTVCDSYFADIGGGESGHFLFSGKKVSGYYQVSSF